jgi:hypothetical protein
LTEAKEGAILGMKNPTNLVGFSPERRSGAEEEVEEDEALNQGQIWAAGAD